MTPKPLKLKTSVARALNAIKDPMKTQKFHEYVVSVLREAGFKIRWDAKKGRFV